MLISGTICWLQLNKLTQLVILLYCGNHLKNAVSEAASSCDSQSLALLQSIVLSISAGQYSCNKTST